MLDEYLKKIIIGILFFKILINNLSVFWKHIINNIEKLIYYIVFKIQNYVSPQIWKAYH